MFYRIELTNFSYNFLNTNLHTCDKCIKIKYYTSTLCLYKKYYVRKEILLNNTI